MKEKLEVAKIIIGGIISYTALMLMITVPFVITYWALSKLCDFLF